MAESHALRRSFSGTGHLRIQTVAAGYDESSDRTYTASYTSGSGRSLTRSSSLRASKRRHKRRWLWSVYLRTLAWQRGVVVVLVALQLLLTATHGIWERSEEVQHTGRIPVIEPQLSLRRSVAPSPSGLSPVDDTLARHRGLGLVRSALEASCDTKRHDGCKHHREVIACVTDANGARSGALATWVAALQRVGAYNFVIASLDDETSAYIEEQQHLRQQIWPYFNAMSAVDAEDRPSTARRRRKGEMVSALKYPLIRLMLELGYDVLMSDLDIAILRNPFTVLERDSDVEGCSDGWDLQTWYGGVRTAVEGKDGLDKKAPLTKRAVFEVMQINAGFIFIRSNERTMEAMRMVAGRLSQRAEWDQLVLNELIWMPSHGSYYSPQLTARIVHPSLFTTSRVFFLTGREALFNFSASGVPPVSVHMNYHCSKHDRVNALYQHYGAHESVLFNQLLDDHAYGGLISHGMLRCRKEGEWDPPEAMADRVGSRSDLELAVEGSTLLRSALNPSTRAAATQRLLLDYVDGDAYIL